MPFRIKTKYAGYQVKNVEFAGNAQIFPNAGVPSNGTTGAGAAGKGSLCIDTTNGKLYINTNTLASPTWVVVGSQT